MEKKFSVYGIGNALIDLQVQATDSALATFDLTKGEMKLADTAEQERILEHFGGAAVNRASGGSGANTVIALAQLLAPVAYGCLVGDDDFGAFYEEDMKRLGVAVNTPQLENEQTGTCVILITPDAERTMVTHLGSSAHFSSVHVSEDFIRDSEWLYVEGYLFSTEAGQESVRAAISLAQQYDTRVAITFSDGFIVDCFGEQLRDAVSHSDLIFANLNEAQKFTGESEPAKAFAKLHNACPNVAMTMSEKGALLRWDGEDITLEPFPVNAVDDTGAGDMFAGAFLYGINHGLSGAEAGRLACFLASRVVSQLGPRISGDIRQLAEAEGLL